MTFRPKTVQDAPAASVAACQANSARTSRSGNGTAPHDPVTPLGVANHHAGWQIVCEANAA